MMMMMMMMVVKKCIISGFVYLRNADAQLSHTQIYYSTPKMEAVGSSAICW
jgi:hypothetical protein